MKAPLKKLRAPGCQSDAPRFAAPGTFLRFPSRGPDHHQPDFARQAKWMESVFTGASYITLCSVPAAPWTWQSTKVTQRCLWSGVKVGKAREGRRAETAYSCALLCLALPGPEEQGGSFFLQPQISHLQKANCNNHNCPKGVSCLQG